MSFLRFLGPILKQIPLWAWGCLLLGLYLGYLNMRLAHEQRERVRYSFQADSLKAEVAVTKLARVSDEVFHVKQMLQARQRRDSVDKVLHLERRAKLQLQARIAGLVDTLEGIVVATPDTTERVAEFNQYREPYRIKARATIPALTPPTLAVDVQLDSIPLELRLGCMKGDGVQSAAVAVKGPTWASLQIAAVNQSPEICNPEVMPAPKGPGIKPYLIGAGVTTVLFFIGKAIQ